ncbi:hypothetical protein Hanom_Chr08g00715221 [Helianthus anomalus]
MLLIAYPSCRKRTPRYGLPRLQKHQNQPGDNSIVSTSFDWFRSFSLVLLDLSLPRKHFNFSE